MASIRTRTPDYEIRSGGGDIAGHIDFLSPTEADELLENWLSRLMKQG